MTRHNLERKSGIQHSTLNVILNSKTKTVTLTKILMLVRGFDMSILEFFDSPHFDLNKLDIE